MPLLKLETSVVLSPEKKSSLLLSLTKVLARDTGKAERHVMVVIEDGAAVMMAGQVVSGAFVDVRGIGGLTGKVNRQLSEDICTILQQECSISPEAVYLNFTDVKADNWGFNRSTFG
jgi:phenylpyruvate tautomerase